MSQIQVSPPFNLAPHDWKSLGFKAIFAVIAAIVGFTTATFIPTLKEHTANEYGVLIVTMLTAFTPWLLEFAKKYLTDTSQVVKLILLAVTLSLLSPCGLYAAEFMGANTGPTGSVITDLFSNLTKDPLLLAALIIGAMLFASKVLKIDLSGLLMPILVSLLKPPGPAPAPTPVIPGPTPGPTPGPLPTPTDPTMAFLLQLLQQLFVAKKNGDVAGEAAASTLIQGLLNKKS